MKLRIIVLLLCLVILSSLPVSGWAESPLSRVDQLAQSILSAQLDAAGAASPQAWLDGPLADTAGSSGEWFVFALSQQGRYDFTAYQNKLLGYLADNTVHAAASRQKFALVLRATGCRDASVDAVMRETLGQQGVMSWVYGLHLINNGMPCPDASAADVVAALLSLQFADGGWALNGSAADVDVTAMVLQSLAPYAAQPDVSAAIGRAVTLLSQRQMADGGFASYGRPNPESAAQVLIALTGLGVDALTDERFIKNGCTLLDAMLSYQLSEGSFSHTMGGAANQTANVQVYMACIAYQRFAQGKPGLYLLDTPVHAAPASPAGAAMGYKPVAALITSGLALLLCLVLLILKKRSLKNYLAVLIGAGLIIGFIFATDFQSAEDYYTAPAIVSGDPAGTVTLSIRCDTVAGKADHIPADGVILAPTVFPIYTGDTVYSVLTRAAKSHRIHLESSGVPGMIYMTGIANLYEFAFGDLSGWNYFLNGESASAGCDQIVLSDGDVIAWHYTCALGEDLK